MPRAVIADILGIANIVNIADIADIITDIMVETSKYI